MLCLFLLTGSEAQHAPDPQICDVRLDRPVKVGRAVQPEEPSQTRRFLLFQTPAAPTSSTASPPIRGSARQRQRRHRHIRIGEFGDIRRLIINSLAVVVLDLLDAHCWRAHIGRNRHGYRVFRQGIEQAGNGVGGLGFLHRVGVGAIGLVYDLAEACLVLCGIRIDRDGS